jgi:hypothetical protein
MSGVREPSFHYILSIPMRAMHTEISVLVLCSFDLKEIPGEGTLVPKLVGDLYSSLIILYNYIFYVNYVSVINISCRDEDVCI